jgi:hypothetical protein
MLAPNRHCDPASAGEAIPQLRRLPLLRGIATPC